MKTLDIEEYRTLIFEPLLNETYGDNDEEF